MIADRCRTSRAKRSRPTLWLLAVASWFGIAANAAGAHEQTFARVCAEREIEVITLIEDHSEAAFTKPFVDNETLGRAGLMLIEARKECYGGRVAEAIALYDSIITMLGPVLVWRTR